MRRIPDGTGDWQYSRRPNDDTQGGDNSGNPGLPALTITDAGVKPGDTATFTVTLGQAYSRDVTFDYQTVDGSATAPQDYTAASGSITIAAGDTSARIAVTTQAASDGGIFYVRLSNVQSASAVDAIGQGSILAPPITEYRMEENGWDGTAGEVNDNTGNGHDATAQGDATTDRSAPAVAGDPGTCRYGVFDGQGDVIEDSDAGAYLNGRRAITVTAWVRNRDAAPNDGGVFSGTPPDATDEDLGLRYDASGALSGNTALIKASIRTTEGWHQVETQGNVQSTGWQHLAFVWRSGQPIRIYLNGNPLTIDRIDSESGRFGGVITGVNTFLVGRGSKGTDWQGAIDEVRVYGQALTQAQIRRVKNDTHPCPSNLVCETRDFSGGSLGQDWEVSNESGAFGNPRIVNGALRLTDQSNNVATRATLLDSIPWDNNRVEVTFRHYAYGRGGGDADGVALAFSDASVAPSPGGYGGSLGYAQRTGVDGFAGGWLGVALDEFGNFSNPTEGRELGPGLVPNAVAIRGDGSGRSGYQYLAGTGSLTPPVSAPNSDNRAPGYLYRVIVDTRTAGQAIVEVQRDTTGTGNNFATLLSRDIAADQSTAPPSQVYLTLTGSTGGSSNIHEIDDLKVCAARGFGQTVSAIEIQHDGSGVTCQAEPVTIRAVDSLGNRVRDFTGAVQLTTSTGNGGWSIADPSVDAFGNLNETGGNDDGAATYTFADADNGEATLVLRDAHVEDVDVDAAWRANPGVTDDDSEGLLSFSEVGFEFRADGTADSVGTQIGGKPSNVAPGSQALELAAIRTNDKTGACEAAFQGSTDVDMAFECRDPSTCQSSSLTVNGTPISATAGSATSGYSTVALDFGGSSDETAPLVINYGDVGKIRLLPRKVLQPNGQTMTGPSNDFVVRPFALEVTAAGNPGASSASGPVFTQAGKPFNATIRAVLWDGSDDGNHDGVADGHNNDDPTDNVALGDNATAKNFGSESGGGEVVRLSASHQAPTGTIIQTPGLSTGQTVSGFSSGVGNTSTRYDEVGVIELRAGVGGDKQYLGLTSAETGLIQGRSGTVGRFIPDHFTTQVDSPSQGKFDSACKAGAGPFTYTGQDFTYLVSPQFTVEPRAATGTITRNYQGTFNKLVQDGLKNLDIANSGADAANGLAWERSASSGSLSLQDRNDGTTTVTLDGDTYDYPKTQAQNTLVGPFQPDIQVDINTYRDSDAVQAQDLPKALHLDGGGTQIRYGRMRIANAYGSERLPLDMPLYAEYYDGNGFVTNQADSCTTYAASGASFANLTGLAASDIAAYHSGTLAAGRADPANPLTVADDASATDGPGRDGAVDVVLSVPPYLRFDWDTSAAGLENPRGRATFGIYRGSDSVIYSRELY